MMPLSVLIQHTALCDVDCSGCFFVLESRKLFAVKGRLALTGNNRIVLFLRDFTFSEHFVQFFTDCFFVKIFEICKAFFFELAHIRLALKIMRIIKTVADSENHCPLL